jgi:hypothetical protein
MHLEGLVSESLVEASPTGPPAFFQEKDPVVFLSLGILTYIR